MFCYMGITAYVLGDAEQLEQIVNISSTDSPM